MSQAPLMFHKDVFIPDFAKAPLFEGAITYSRHAQNVSSGTEGVDAIELPKVFNAKDATLVEVEVNPATGEVEKQVWRMPLDDQNDLCFPMLPSGLIKTVWLNARTDTHSTLRRTRYVGGFQWRNMKNKLGKSAKL